MTGNPMTCEECRENLEAARRGELPPSRASALEAHLAACPACRRERERNERLAALLRSLPELSPSPDGWPRLAARIAREAPGDRRRSLLRVTAPALGLATAAVLAVFLLLPPASPPPPAILLAAGDLTAGGLPVSPGARLTLRDGAELAARSLARAEIESGRRLELTLDRGARLVLEGRGRIRLAAGRILARVRPGPGAMRFLLPRGEVEVTGTLLVVEAGSRRARVAVLRGEAAVVLGSHRLPVPAGRGVTVDLEGGAMTGPVPVDPWRIRDWCSSPAASLRADSSRITLTLANDKVAPLTLLRFDPADADYFLRIEGPEGTLEPVKVQGRMVVSGAREPGGPAWIRLLPGEAYRLTIDLGRVGLPPGTYRVRAVYRPYGDLPEQAWRGVLRSEPVTLTLR